MKVQFLKLAQSELDDAFIWYESQLEGLGYRFLGDFELYSLLLYLLGIIIRHKYAS